MEERLKAKGEEERGNVSIKRSIIQQEKTIKELERELGEAKAHIEELEKRDIEKPNKKPQGNNLEKTVKQLQRELDDSKGYILQLEEQLERVEDRSARRPQPHLERSLKQLERELGEAKDRISELEDLLEKKERDLDVLAKHIESEPQQSVDTDEEYQKMLKELKRDIDSKNEVHRKLVEQLQE